MGAGSVPQSEVSQRKKSRRKPSAQYKVHHKNTHERVKSLTSVDSDSEASFGDERGRKQAPHASNKVRNSTANKQDEGDDDINYFTRKLRRDEEKGNRNSGRTL